MCWAKIAYLMTLNGMGRARNLKDCKEWTVQSYLLAGLFPLPTWLMYTSQQINSFTLWYFYRPRTKYEGRQYLHLGMSVCPHPGGGGYPGQVPDGMGEGSLSGWWGEGQDWIAGGLSYVLSKRILRIFSQTIVVDKSHWSMKIMKVKKISRDFMSVIVSKFYMYRNFVYHLFSVKV